MIKRTTLPRSPKDSGAGLPWRVHLLPYPLWSVTRCYPFVLTQKAWPVALMSAMPKHHEEIQVRVSFSSAMLVLTVHGEGTARNFSSTEVGWKLDSTLSSCGTWDLASAKRQQHCQTYCAVSIIRKKSACKHLHNSWNSTEVVLFMILLLMWWWSNSSLLENS